MDVKLNKHFEVFLYAQEVGFDYGLTFSLKSSPKLKDFLDDLDPELPLDWSGKSFFGLPELRERVVASQGYNVSPEQILITAGTNEANHLVLTQAISAGDEVVMDAPSWPQVYELCKAYGAKIKLVKRKEERGWALDMDELNEAVTPATKLIFVNSPNNPTGAVFNEQEMESICEIARANDAYLLSDEVYRNLEWDGTRSPAAVNYYEKAISTSSVSKTAGLQGIRTGWMATRDQDLRYRCMVLREDTSEVMNVLGEYIAFAALEPSRYAKLLAEARDEGNRCWPLIENWLARRSNIFSWVKPKAGYLCFVKYNLDIGSEELFKRLIAAPYRTLIQPGIGYGHENYIRMGVGGGNEEEISKGLEQFDKFIHDFQAEA